MSPGPRFATQWRTGRAIPAATTGHATGLPARASTPPAICRTSPTGWKTITGRGIFFLAQVYRLGFHRLLIYPLRPQLPVRTRRRPLVDRKAGGE